MWSNNLNVQIILANQSVIHAYINPPTPQSPWLFTGVYGPPQPQARLDLWKDFNNIIPTHNLPCLLMGDFNEVLCQEEKKGGRIVGHDQAKYFKEVIDSNGLINLGFTGIPFTWSNKQKGSDLILERLDRGLINQQCLQIHPHAMIQHLPRIASDHAPILLKEKAIPRPPQKPFRVEQLWILHPHLPEVVNDAWNPPFNPSPQTNLLIKMSNTANTLQNWRKNTLGYLPGLIKGAEKKTQSAQAHCARSSGAALHYWLEKELEARNTHLVLVHCQEVFWKQRSRVQWLREGDLNTTFFHTQATIHRRINHIRQIQREDGSWLNHQWN